MLGLLLIYWIGKSFYNLAEKNEKGNWLYAILGVVSFYAAQIVLIALLIIIAGDNALTDSEVALNLIGVIAGGLSCWGLYQYLDYRWSEAAKQNQAESYLQDSDLLDDDMILAE